MEAFAIQFKQIHSKKYDVHPKDLKTSIGNITILYVLFILPTNEGTTAVHIKGNIYCGSIPRVSVYRNRSSIDSPSQFHQQDV